MVNELSLSGNDLICYAIIYGFSQDDNYWEGSQSYLSEWLGISKRATVDILKRLISDGHIVKQEYEVNKVKFCKYKAVVPNFMGSEESALGGSEESSHDNKSSIKKEKEDKSSFSKERLDYDEILAKWKEICPNLSQPRMLNEKRKKIIRELLKSNNATTDDLYKAFQMISISSYCHAKHPRNETWKATLDWLINDTKGCFNRLLEGEFAYTQSERDLAEKIKRGGFEQVDCYKSEYKPYGSNFIRFSEKHQCYIFTGFYTGTIIDGYEDDERPDGATLRINSCLDVIVWSKAEKKWILKK